MDITNEENTMPPSGNNYDWSKWLPAAILIITGYAGYSVTAYKVERLQLDLTEFKATSQSLMHQQAQADEKLFNRIEIKLDKVQDQYENMYRLMNTRNFGSTP